MVLLQTSSIVGRRMPPKDQERNDSLSGFANPHLLAKRTKIDRRFHGLVLDRAPTSYFSFLLPKRWTDKGFAIRPYLFRGIGDNACGTLCCYGRRIVPDLNLQSFVFVWVGPSAEVGIDQLQRIAEI